MISILSLIFPKIGLPIILDIVIKSKTVFDFKIILNNAAKITKF